MLDVIQCFRLIDTAQKIIGVLLKELDDYARSSMRDELASLDPVLRSAGLGHAGHDFDGAG